MITAQMLNDAGIKDQWPEIRAMAQHGRFYGFLSSQEELEAALDYLDQLPAPEELRAALQGDEAQLVKLYHSNPLIHALISIGRQYADSKRLIITDDRTQFDGVLGLLDEATDEWIYDEMASDGFPTAAQSWRDMQAERHGA